MKKSKMQMQKITVSLDLPKQYIGFWEELRKIYGLPTEALGQHIAGQLVEFLNDTRDEMELPYIGISWENVRPSLSLKEKESKDREE